MRSDDDAMTRSSPRVAANARPTSAESNNSAHRSTRTDMKSMRSKSATSVSASSTKVRANHSSRLSMVTPRASRTR